MNNKFALWIIGFFVCAIVLGISFAYSYDTSAERILRFNSGIEVHEDGSMTVTETIRVYGAGNQIRHGIYRDFPTRYKDKLGNRHRVDFQVKEVLRDGSQEGYHLQPLSNGMRVYIGKKDVTLSPGEYTYTLVYTTHRQIGFFKDFDELYWNVTGNGWVFPIELASATITLPQRVFEESLKIDGYTGYAGSTEKNFSVTIDKAGSSTFTTTVGLLPEQGLTIVVAWPKGIVTEPTLKQKIGYFFADNLAALVGFLGLAVIICYYLLVWYRFGRDPSKGTIIPLYNPPDGLSPAASRFIYKMGFDNKVFTTAIINMAVKGYLSITEKKGTYTLTRSLTPGADLSAEEKALAFMLFASSPEIIVETQSHEKISAALRKTREALKNSYERSYFLTNRRYFIPGVIISAVVVVSCALCDSFAALPVVIFLSIWLTFWSIGVTALLITVFSSWKEYIMNCGQPCVARAGGLLIKALFLSFFSLPFVAGEVTGVVFLVFFCSMSVAMILGAMVGVNFLFYYLLKAPTLLGRKTMDKIEGFKMYLSVAEKERLNLLNPPEKTPELFERYLPYALALDVEQQWAQQFSSLLQEVTARRGEYKPSWYSGSSFHLSATAFASSLGNAFSGSISSATHPPGSSSGGSGGGSSGGGGGGGGGGGW